MLKQAWEAFKNILPKPKITIFYLLVLVFIQLRLCTPVFAQTTTPFPTPNMHYAYTANYIPNNTEVKIANLIAQIGLSKGVKVNILLLDFLLSFPGPIQTKLGIFDFLANHLPFMSTVIPVPFIVPLLFLGPIGILLILVLCIFVLFKIISLVLSIIVPVIMLLFKKAGFKVDKKEDRKTFLELTFPSDTTKSSFATEQLFVLLHTRARMIGGWQSFLKQKKAFSLEIVSSKDNGIRFLLGAAKKDVDVIHKSLISYLPGLKIKEIKDYLPQTFDLDNEKFKIAELKLSSDFVLPLKSQKALAEHDPISYLIGQMTKLNKGELVAFQIVTTPVLSSIHGKAMKRTREIMNRISKGVPLTPVLDNGSIFSSLPSFWWLLLGLPVWIVIVIMKFIVSVMQTVFTSGNIGKASERRLQMVLNPYEQELAETIKEKLDQHLFESSIRILAVSTSTNGADSRLDELMVPFGQFTSSNQAFERRGTFPFFSSFAMKSRFSRFKERILSEDSPVLSSSEISDIFHFPYTDITKTEGLVKSKSKELPAPLSLKKTNANFDVVIGVSEYAGEQVPIGITLEQRLKHMYIIGKTGMGKTTLMTSSIYQDMVNGKGLAVFDPHGDMLKELLGIIPENRRKDVILFDPSDRNYPIGLNLLSPGIKFRNEEDEHDWITSSVLAVFKKLADEKYWGPRMEHILRNATLTALLIPNPTLFTLQRLLTDKKYQKEVAATLKDPVLKQFWQKEFALMGRMQVSSVTAPLTQRLGAFISSKMSRNILLQEKSSISISNIMDEGKILLINLSKGDLGEDQSFFFGTILTSFIWMAAYQRTKIPESKRKDLFIYVDEFQNFATPQFAEITSEGRKFHVSLIASHQNIAQVKDKDILKVVAGNANTIVCLKASPEDEAFILPFMEPEVKKGDIVNLAPFNFFMKVTGDESEDAFSGKTVLIDVKSSEKTKDEAVTYTRKHYATPRIKVEKYLEKLFTDESDSQVKITSKTTLKRYAKSSKKKLNKAQKKENAMT